MLNQFSNHPNKDYVILWMPVLVPRDAIQQLPTFPPALQLQSCQPVESVPSPTQSSYPVAKETKGRIGMASNKQKELVRKLAKDHRMTDADLCNEIGVKSINEMSNSQANAFISKYKDQKSFF